MSGMHRPVKNDVQTVAKIHFWGDRPNFK